MKKLLSIHSIFYFILLSLGSTCNKIYQYSIHVVLYMIKCLRLTVCYLMSYFLIQFQIILWRTYSATIWFVRGTGMLVAFSSSSFYNLKTLFLFSYAMQFSVLLYYWYYWQRNVSIFIICLKWVYLSYSASWQINL